jgi:hypothetical protein
MEDIPIYGARIETSSISSHLEVHSCMRKQCEMPNRLGN